MVPLKCVHLNPRRASVCVCVVGVGRTALFISIAEFQGGVGGTASLPDSVWAQGEAEN